MAVRTTPTKVQAILSADYDAGVALEPYIDVASSMLDYIVDHCIDAAALSASQLGLIEGWLASHFYAVANGKFASNSTAGGSASFQGQSAMNLASTTYGQAAMTADMSNCLAKHNDEVNKGTKRKIVPFWLGKTPSEQTPYEQRN